MVCLRRFSPAIHLNSFLFADPYYFLQYDAPGSDASTEKQLATSLLSLDVDGRVIRLDTYVSPSIQPFIRDKLDDAKAMWNILAKKFQQQNATSRFITVSNFLSIQKGAVEPLSTLIS